MLNPTARFYRRTIQGVSLLLVIAMAAMALPTAALAAPQPAAAVAATSTPNCESTYTAKTGDTLKSIAKEHGLTVSALAAANGLKKTASISAGDKLCIPPSQGAGISSKNFKLDARIVATTLFVEASGLNKNRAYVLKARGQSKGSSWVKLGSFASNKDGTLTIHVRVPEAMVDSNKSIQVCLKDASSDALVCRTIKNQ